MRRTLIAFVVLLGSCQNPCPPKPHPDPGDPKNPPQLPKKMCLITKRLEVVFSVDVINPRNAKRTTILQDPNLTVLAPFVSLLTQYNADIEPSVGTRLAQRLRSTRSFTIRFPDEARFDAKGLINIANEIRLLTNGGGVARVGLVPSASPPDEDPLLGNSDTSNSNVATSASGCGNQWYVNRMNVNDVWDGGITGNAVVVADVDWGLVPTHDDIAAAIDAAHPFNICGAPSMTPTFRRPHGTGVAAMIAGRRNPVGIRGIAYNSKLWPIQASCWRTNPNREPCDQDWKDVEGNPWAAGILAASTENCGGCPKVVLLEAQTCCGGNYEGSLAVQYEIEQAIANGVVVVVAAGNGPKDAGRDDHGATIPDTGSILVGATKYSSNSNENLPTSDSNFGTAITVWAPGDSTTDLTATSNDAHSTCGPPAGDNSLYTLEFGGTSGAAAKVAGVVALMLEKNRELTPAQVRCILKPPNKPAVFLDALDAVNKAGNPPPECQ